MALGKKTVLFKDKALRINHGVSDVSGKPVIQLVIVSPATGEVKSVNIAQSRAEEIAASLEAAADSLRKMKPLAAAGPAADPLLHTEGAHGIAVLGVRGHGKKHLEAFLGLQRCRIAYICDVDTAVGNQAADMVMAKAGYRPAVVQDFREALADPSVDAVSIATPHHWHALASIWALQAGKHVYLEKPISHTLMEGESILAAAAKYGKVVQAGTQLRSNMSLRAAHDYMAGGKLGAVKLVHCIVYKPRPPIGATAPVAVPSAVDYDLWCGPASNAAPLRGKFHYAWHWFWEYGNGALGNNGIHRVDAARIGLGLSGMGDATLSFGGRFGPDDGGETPNTQVALHRFGDTWIMQEVLGLPTKPFKKVSNGIIFYGTKGTIIYHKGHAALCEPDGTPISAFPGEQKNHYQDFIDAIEANDAAAVRGNLHESHVSAAICHLGNISYRVGKAASDEEISAALTRLKAPAFAHETLARVRAHLTLNGETGPLVLGRALEVDEARGFIVNDPEAAALLQREDRAPYIVPLPADV